MPAQTTGIRVLFTGDYWPGSNTVYIAHAFEQCGAIIRFLDLTTFWPTGWERKAGRVARRLLRPLIEREWNQKIVEMVDTFTPDLVYITNAHYCWPKTLKLIRAHGIPVMCFYHDPPWKTRSWSRFADNLPYFDLVASTRSWHEDEFKQGGAKNVSIVRFGYEPTVHRPFDLSALDTVRRAQYQADIVFVGTCRPLRTQTLTCLTASSFPYQLKIWGNQWNQLSTSHPLRSYWQKRDVLEQEIPIVYAASKVALHWLNWEPENEDPALRKGDQHNSRTFQAAACGGGLLMAQRTSEHERFFEEDKEAVFFSDIGELREKLAFWLDPARDDLRRKIALAARKRCVTEDYSYKPIAQGFLDYFSLPRLSTS